MVDISLKGETKSPIQHQGLRMRGGEKIDSSARGSGADVRRMIKEDELHQ